MSANGLLEWLISHNYGVTLYEIQRIIYVILRSALKVRVMKKRVAGLVVLFSISLIPLQAATPPKSGAVCPKLNSTKVFEGKKFTCKKSGKKLLWDKGVVVVKPKPTATPTPTPTASPMPTPAPTLTPAPVILTFENILANYQEIGPNVYAQAQKFLASNFQSKLKVSTYVGPNSKLQYQSVTGAYIIGSKFFQNFQQPDVVHSIYYTFADKEWARKQIQTIDGSNRWDYQMGYSCPSGQVCWDSSAGVSLNWQGIGHYGTSDPGGSFYKGEINGEREIHEFAHMMCAYQLKPTWGNYYGLTPDWFSEGHASTLGRVGGSKSLAEYRLDRENGRRKPVNAMLKSYSAENILRFYESMMDRKSNPEMREFVYNLGHPTLEALSAIGGLDSPMNLYLETVKGATFRQAFKTVYGIEWSAAAPILADVVAVQFKPYWP